MAMDSKPLSSNAPHLSVTQRAVEDFRALPKATDSESGAATKAFVEAHPKQRAYFAIGQDLLVESAQRSKGVVLASELDAGGNRNATVDVSRPMRRAIAATATHLAIATNDAATAEARLQRVQAEVEGFFSDAVTQAAKAHVDGLEHNVEINAKFDKARAGAGDWLDAATTAVQTLPDAGDRFNEVQELRKAAAKLLAQTDVAKDLGKYIADNLSADEAKGLVEKLASLGENLGNASDTLSVISAGFLSQLSDNVVKLAHAGEVSAAQEAFNTLSGMSKALGVPESELKGLSLSFQKVLGASPQEISAARATLQAKLTELKANPPKGLSEDQAGRYSDNVQQLLTGLRLVLQLPSFVKELREFKDAGTEDRVTTVADTASNVGDAGALILGISNEADALAVAAGAADFLSGIGGGIAAGEAFYDAGKAARLHQWAMTSADLLHGVGFSGAVAAAIAPHIGLGDPGLPATAASLATVAGGVAVEVAARKHQAVLFNREFAAYLEGTGALKPEVIKVFGKPDSAARTVFPFLKEVAAALNMSPADLLSHLNDSLNEKQLRTVKSKAIRTQLTGHRHVLHWPLPKEQAIEQLQKAGLLPPAQPAPAAPAPTAPAAPVTAPAAPVQQ